MTAFDRPAFCFTFDGDGVVTDTYSGSGLDRLGFDPGDMVGSSVFELVPPDSDVAANVRRALGGERFEASVVFGGHRFRVWYVPEMDDGLVRHVNCLVLDVTEEAQRQELVTVLNRVLRHNLRNKLTVIMGLADDMRKDDPVDDRPERIIDASEDLVELSRKVRRVQSFTAAAGDFGPMDLDLVVRSVTMRVVDPVADVDVTVDLPDEAVRVRAGVEPVLAELLENAIEHNEPPREVWLEASIDGDLRDLLTIEIGDNGPGLPADERLVVEGGEETPLSHASSIGLWLARWAAESAGGDLTVVDADVGTTFRLAIPISG